MKYVVLLNRGDDSINKCVCRLLDDVLVLNAKDSIEAMKYIEEFGENIICVYADYDCKKVSDGEFITEVTSKSIPCIVMVDEDCGDDVVNSVFAKGAIDYILRDDPFINCKYMARMADRLRVNPGIKVLVVSGYEPTRKSIVDILKKHKYNVLTVGDGVEALEIFEEHSDIKAAIVDHDICLISGLGLVSSIRHIYPEDVLTIIGTALNPGDRLATAFIKAGANDFIKTPFRKEELASRLIHNIEMLSHIEHERVLATVDSMTGLYSKRFFLEMADKTLAKAKRAKSSLVIATFELTNFKYINVNYGHAVANKILQAIAQVLQGRFRNSDILARIEKSTFCVLAVDMNHDETEGIFAALLEQIKAIKVESNSGVIDFDIAMDVSTEITQKIASITENKDKKAFGLQ